MRNQEKKIWGGKTILSICALMLSAGVIVAAFFLFGNMSAESKKNEFAFGDGFIISSVLTDDGVTSTRQYFAEKTTYKNGYSDNIEFKNSSGDEVSVGTESFVHYSDGSIGVLKKVALLDLTKLKDDKDHVVAYYNLMPSAVLRRISGSYVAELQGERVTFGAVLLKVSENKYLVAAPEISVRVGEKTNKIKNGFLEVTYFDGDIIRVENQELTYQSIADEIAITVGDTELDLRNKYINKNNVAVLDFGLITINSDDNIALSDYTPPEVPSADEGEGGENGEGEDGENNDPTKDWEDLLADLSNGVVESSTDPNEINEYERSNDPVFTITSLAVTANSFNATVEVEDKDGLLTGDTRIDIIELSNGNAVFQRRLTDGETFFDISTENLSPETEYAFVVTSDYMKDNAEISRTFIQKTFITEAVGVTVQPNYTTTTTVSVIVNRSDFSRVRELNAVLIDPVGDEVASRAVNFEDEGNNVTINFSSNLTPNTLYKLQLKDFRYMDMIVTNGFTITRDVMTLKRRPTLGSPIFTIDKREGVFNANIGETVDLDNGIVSYRYELYDAREVTVDPETNALVTGTPVYQVDKPTRTGVDIPVDGESIKRGVPYVYRVVATFNNNIFEYELATGVSNVMQMDGKAFPVLTFIEDEVTFERIDGKILIIDDGGVLDITKEMILSYSNSVGEGEVKPATVSSNLEVPFFKDGLRKNESYTLSLYGTIDLKDGNDPIEHCYIGSVIVQTKATNPFVLNHTEYSDPNSVFSVAARLSEGDEGSTELEADTLSGLTFNIYRGTDTSGNPMRSAAKFDENKAKYESDLRAEYYDRDFIINPSLFGLRNKDFSSGTYTIEVTGAYDYTTYKNEIGIKNNVFTVEVSGSVPDIPVDKNDAVDIVPILNRDAPADKKRADLNDDTVVGYSIVAEYDNSSHTLKDIYYVIHSADGSVVKEITYTLPAGEINVGWTQIFFDGDGTSGVDSDFRRGNEYYITYTAGLDTIDSDGRVDVIWPVDGTILRSKPFTPVKQMPELLAYPVSSDTSTYDWRYKLTDVDNAITTPLSYSVNDTATGTIPLTPSEDYQNLHFDNLTKGEFESYYRYRLVKTDNETIVIACSQKFEGIYTPELPTFNVDIENNRAIFSFSNIDTNVIYDRTAYIRVVLKDSADSNVLKTFENMKINENGTIVINLSEMADLVGQAITPHVYLYYDTGVTGFGINNERVAVLHKINNGYEYYSLANNRLYSNVTALGSFFNYGFNFEQSSLALTSNIDGGAVSFELQPTAGGYTYEGNVVMLKELNESDISSNRFEFDTVVPSVSVKEINADLMQATVKAQVFGLSDNSVIRDSKLYLDVYKSDSTWTSSALVIDDLEASIVDNEVELDITGLEVGTYYFFRIFADIRDGSGYTRMQLYDVDDPNSNDKTYRFVTLSKVVVEDIKVEYSASSQANRRFRVSYSFDRVVSVDGIRYEVWRVNEDGEKLQKIDLEISDDTEIQKDMVKYIPIPSGCGVETGQYYKVYIIPYALSGSEKVDISETESGIYYFAQLLAPFVGVSSRLVENGTKIRFAVMTIDRKKSVVNGTYQIKILDKDGHDITPEEYNSGRSYTMGDTEYFYLSDFDTSDEYSFVVTYTLDATNSGEENYVLSTRTYNVRTIDIDPYVGNVTATADSTDGSKIRLVFNDSVAIDEISSLQFLVGSSSVATTWEYQTEFVPSQVSVSDGSVYYYFTLPNVKLTTPGNYYIQLQFSNASGTVLTNTSLEYLFVGAQ